MIGRPFVIFGATISLILVVMLGLYLRGRLEGAATERLKTTEAETRAKVAELETTGERASAARVDVVVRQQSVSRDVVRNLAIEAAKSEDSNVPLAPDRVLRLRDADGELCRIAPDLIGCGAAH